MGGLRCMKSYHKLDYCITNQRRVNNIRFGHYISLLFLKNNKAPKSMLLQMHLALEAKSAKFWQCFSHFAVCFYQQ